MSDFEKNASSEPERRITKNLLKNVTGEFSIESIHTVDLSKRGLIELGCIGECTSLERLALSSNRLTSVTLLASLVNVVHVDLSSNQLSSLDGIQTLVNLSTLNLAGNLISGLEVVRGGLASLCSLVDVRFADDVLQLTNPVCANALYRAAMMSIVPSLVRLDGKSVKGKGSSLYDQYTILDNLMQACETALKSSTMMAETPAPVNLLDESLTIVSSSQDTVSSAERRFNDMVSECKNVLRNADKFITSNS